MSIDMTVQIMARCHFSWTMRRKKNPSDILAIAIPMTPNDWPMASKRTARGMWSGETMATC